MASLAVSANLSFSSPNLDTVQGIQTSSSPTFASLTLSGTKADVSADETIALIDGEFTYSSGLLNYVSGLDVQISADTTGGSYIVQMNGIHVKDVVDSGTLSAGHVSGIRIDEQTQGGAFNWSLYSEGISFMNQLIVGSAVLPTRDFEVHGNSYLSGILNIGDSTIYNNGSTNLCLTAVGNLWYLENSNSAQEFNISNSNSDSSAYSSLILRNDASSCGLHLNSSTRSADGNTNNATLRNNGGKLFLQGSGLASIDIDTTGNVRIGCSPSYPLHVFDDSTQLCLQHITNSKTATFRQGVAPSRRR